MLALLAQPSWLFIPKALLYRRIPKKALAMQTLYWPVSVESWKIQRSKASDIHIKCPHQADEHNALRTMFDYQTLVAKLGSSLIRRAHMPGKANQIIQSHSNAGQFSAAVANRPFEISFSINWTVKILQDASLDNLWTAHTRPLFKCSCLHVWRVRWHTSLI